MIDKILKTYGEVNTTANGFPPNKSCKLINAFESMESNSKAIKNDEYVSNASSAIIALLL